MQRCAMMRGSLTVQCKITVLKLGEIHGLCPEGDPFDGIIAEFPAAVRFVPQTAFAANNGTVLNLDPMGAIGAGAFYLFPKQHHINPFQIVVYIIHQFAAFFYC